MMGEAKVNFTVIRPKREDLKDLGEIYLEGYRGLEEYSYTHPEDVKAYMEWIWRRDPEGIFVAEVEGKKVGFVAGDANWFSKRSSKKVGAVHEIVVLPEYRGMGIGKTLMDRVMTYFKEKGLDTVELWVGDENFRAIEFYRKLGFKESGRYNYWIRMVKEI